MTVEAPVESEDELAKLATTHYDGCTLDMVTVVAISKNYVDGVPVNPRTGATYAVSDWFGDLQTLVHDVKAAEVDKKTFFSIREDGGTRISSALVTCKELLDQHYDPSEWNVYLFHFSDGDNWGDDNDKCLGILKERLLPKVNLFGYAQVESPYGSGEFMDHIEGLLDSHPNVIATKVPDKEAILSSSDRRPVAISFDDQGVLYVAETARRGTVDIDIRSHRDWLVEDLANQSVDDLRQFFRRRRSLESQREHERYLLAQVVARFLLHALGKTVGHAKHEGVVHERQCLQRRRRQRSAGRGRRWVRAVVRIK